MPPGRGDTSRRGRLREAHQDRNAAVGQGQHVRLHLVRIPLIQDSLITAEVFVQRRLIELFARVQGGIAVVGGGPPPPRQITADPDHDVPGR